MRWECRFSTVFSQYIRQRTILHSVKFKQLNVLLNAEIRVGIGDSFELMGVVARGSCRWVIAGSVGCQIGDRADDSGITDIGVAVCAWQQAMKAEED